MDSHTHSTHRDHQVQLGLDHEIQDGTDWMDEISMPLAPDDRWWACYFNIVRLGRVLQRHGWRARALQAYYESPWRFDNEWRRYCEE